MIIGQRAMGLCPKIDIYVKHPDGTIQYKCSTNSARTLKEAKERYAASSKSFTSADLKAFYSREYSRRLHINK